MKEINPKNEGRLVPSDTPQTHCAICKKKFARDETGRFPGQPRVTHMECLIRAVRK